MRTRDHFTPTWRAAVANRKTLSLGAIMVLHALARGREYGFDVMEETGLSSGTIYPALDRLEKLGFARSEWEDARVARTEKRPPRRYWYITPEGARELQGALERHRSLAPVDLTAHLARRTS